MKSMIVDRVLHHRRWSIPASLLIVSAAGFLIFRVFPLQTLEASDRFKLWRAGLSSVESAAADFGVAWQPSGCEHREAEARPPCACVVFVHGMGDSVVTWRKLLGHREWLSRVSRPVKLLAWDLPAHGRTPEPANNPDGDLQLRAQAQAQRLLHYSASDFYEQRYQELAAALAATAPWKGPSRVLLQNSGTEAVEASIKLARYMSGRQWIVGFVGGFHGRTLGALTLTNSKAKYHAHFGPLAPGFLHVAFGSTGLDELEERIMARTIPGDEIAAFVVEPIQGEGGYIVPENGFLEGLRKLCDTHGIVLVADEIQSGFCRTGDWFAIEHDGVVPDLITTAKGR